MNKLNFLTPGIPSSAKNYKDGLNVIKDMDLDGLEIEFVHGVRMNEDTQNFVKNFISLNNLTATCHGPFYINLNSQEQEKIDAGIKRILETAAVAKNIGAFSITFHAAFYMGQNPSDVYNTVYKSMEYICSELEKQQNHVWIRPETTGKGTQWGSLEEITELSKNFKYVLPCIDFAHLHARNNGEFNTYDEFSKIMEYIGCELGDYVFNNFHAHLAGIEYGLKGEKKHLNLQESDMNYTDLLKVLKKFDVKGALVCESPNIEADTKLLKDYYLSL